MLNTEDLMRHYTEEAESARWQLGAHHPAAERDRLAAIAEADEDIAWQLLRLQGNPWEAMITLFHFRDQAAAAHRQMQAAPLSVPGVNIYWLTMANEYAAAARALEKLLNQSA
jgi:hypothetical protein